MPPKTVVPPMIPPASNAGPGFVVQPSFPGMGTRGAPPVPMTKPHTKPTHKGAPQRSSGPHTVGTPNRQVAAPSRADKSKQHATGNDAKGMIRFEDGSVSYRPTSDENNRRVRQIVQRRVDKGTKAQLMIAQDAAGKNGGVMFNPNAKLDPSQVTFVRGIEAYPGQSQSRTPNFGTPPHTKPSSDPAPLPQSHGPDTKAQVGGRTGYCKICDSEHRKDIDKRLKSGHSANTIIEWLATVGFKVTDATIYSHQKHAFNKAVAVKTVPIAAQSTDLLDLVIEAGKAAVQADPSIVSLKNALDAQVIKDRRREHQDDLRMELARMVMAGKVQSVALLAEPSTEGEFLEIE